MTLCYAVFATIAFEKPYLLGFEPFDFSQGRKCRISSVCRAC